MYPFLSQKSFRSSRTILTSPKKPHEAQNPIPPHLSSQVGKTMLGVQEFLGTQAVSKFLLGKKKPSSFWNKELFLFGLLMAKRHL